MTNFQTGDRVQHIHSIKPLIGTIKYIYEEKLYPDSWQMAIVEWDNGDIYSTNIDHIKEISPYKFKVGDKIQSKSGRLYTIIHQQKGVDDELYNVLELKDSIKGVPHAHQYVTKEIYMEDYTKCNDA